MALVDGQEAKLGRLQGDVFILADGTEVSPERVQLNIPEMQGLTESGQAGVLLASYDPVLSADEKHAGFRKLTNHERHVKRRKAREAAAKAAQEAKNGQPNS